MRVNESETFLGVRTCLFQAITAKSKLVRVLAPSGGRYAMQLAETVTEVTGGVETAAQRDLS